MESDTRTRDELVRELQALRSRVAALEARSAEREWSDEALPGETGRLGSRPHVTVLEGKKVEICGVPIAWDREKGTCTLANRPMVMLWINTSLEGLMSGLQSMVGTERFALALQSEGRKSVEDEWRVISESPDFRSAFEAIANVAAVAGWGDCELRSVDEEKKTCRFRVRSSWEGRYQKMLGVSWGSAMLAGKTAGLCSKLFETNCWVEQTASIARGDEFDEFVVAPSDRSIEDEIENLLATDEATRADMAVALQKLRNEAAERKRAEEALALYGSRLEELVRERTEELECSREELRRSERLASVGTLAAGVAHQINNPLGAIVHAAQLALSCEGEEDALAIWKMALQDSVQHAQRCGRIVRSILQFSRNQATEKWSEEVDQVVRRACQLTDTYAAERGAVLEFEPCPLPGSVLMNPIEIEQVLVNVIRNAIESRSEGARVDVRCQSTADVVRVEVGDNGRGIDQEALKHVFDPFFTTRLIEGGTGLGLSVAHGIVADHGGTLSVESAPGHGTVVSIELPRDRGSASG